MIVNVESLSDPRLDDYRNVPDPELLRARGVFVAEGRLVVRRLLEASSFATRSMLLTPAAYEQLAATVQPHADLPVYVVPQDTMNAIVGFNIHRGCLAIGERPQPRGYDALIAGASRVIVLERVSNADNVGGIFRSAAAFGADAVLLGPGCADPLYRKAIRTSIGAALTVPFAALPDWRGDLGRLRRAGFQLVALTPAADALPLRAAVPRDTARVAVLVGHEGEGLTEEALQAADIRACIPMTAGVDSLNVAAAASIALYELFSRRSHIERGVARTADGAGMDPISHPPEDK